MSAERVSSAPDFLKHFPSIHDQLACPACHGELHAEATRLTCVQCGRAYPVIDGIPVLVPAADSQQR